MKLYAPKYYKNFKCIADKCEHSCCIGWEIDIDERTIKKYKALKCAYASVILDSISMESTPHFTLAHHDRCPHLNEHGLCNIIINVGEDHLCDICREHPRFYNYTKVAEVGIGMSCAEAARIILRSNSFMDMDEIGDIDTDLDDVSFDGRILRSDIYEILLDTANTYTIALNKIYRKYSINVGDDERWLQLLNSLEYLDIDHKKLFMNYSSALRPNGTEKNEYLKRFFAYLVYRHCTEAIDEGDFCLRLAFCLFCERLLSSLICSENAESLTDIVTLASIISEEIEYSDENTFTLMY